MRIPNVDKFLFCMKLETGGQVLGWFTAIVASFLLLSNLLAFGASVFSYDALLNSTSMDPEQKHSMENFQWIVSLVFFLLAAYSAVCIYAAVQLIRSVNSRSSRQVRLYMLLIGFETIVALLPLMQFTWVSFCQAVIGFIINGYLFVCIHSLWELFRDEAMRGYNRQYMPAQMVNKV